MKFDLPAGSRLYTTFGFAHYDQVILPAGMKAMSVFYARRGHTHAWYSLMARHGIFGDEKSRNTFVFEDPHGQTPQSEGQIRVDNVGCPDTGKGLCMPDETDPWYELEDKCPTTIDAFQLPVDVRVIKFLGYTQDLAKRLVVVDSRFYPDTYVRAYAGSSFDNPLAPVTELDPMPSTVYKNGELKIVMSPLTHQAELYFPVDPAAYSFREALGGLSLERR